MPETQWTKLSLGCVFCIGFNPKCTVKSKQWDWQMATTPLCFAYEGCSFYSSTYSKNSNVGRGKQFAGVSCIPWSAEAQGGEDVNQKALP